MKKMALVFGLIYALSLSPACSQAPEGNKLNFDFEQRDGDRPAGWRELEPSDYVWCVDSVTVHGGKYSLSIERPEGAESGHLPLVVDLPDVYEGKEMTLSGYIKTENVTDGYVGLWMASQPNQVFANMNEYGIAGTADWEKYEISMKLDPARTKSIWIGVVLKGKGKVWFDDLELTIDGKDISLATIHQRKIYPAENDHEFDHGSGIVFPVLDERRILDLELLGKVWGFLKYHHPTVAQGEYNWDYELFRMLPDYLKTENNLQRDEVLVRWIDGLGEVAVSEPAPVRADAFLKPAISWIDNAEMSEVLRGKIRHVYSNRHNGQHYYIMMHQYVGNPNFINEEPHDGMPYPDAGFRLLSLYRYWNMIQYYFPYRHLTDKPWDDVLGDHIPAFIDARDELEYEIAALQLIWDVHDTHANLWAGEDKIAERRGGMYAPFKAGFVEGKFVILDYYNPELVDIQELRIGDIITHVNGKTIESIVDSLRPYYPASNEPTRLRDISEDILRSQEQTLTIEYIGREGSRTKEIELYEEKKLNKYLWYKVNENEKCYKFLEGNIGYVTLANIKDEDFPVIKETFRDARGIIIDIRNYPSAFTPFTLAPFFVSEPNPFVKFSNGSVDNPGEFTFTSVLLVPKDKETFKGKLVVLMNEISQSSAEYQCMAFRAGDNTTVIGSTTAAADGNISRIALPGGLYTTISGIGIYYPDGTETQRIGIVPDIELRPTIKGISNGRDELLEKAVEVINKGK